MTTHQSAKTSTRVNSFKKTRAHTHPPTILSCRHPSIQAGRQAGSHMCVLMHSTHRPQTREEDETKKCWQPDKADRKTRKRSFHPPTHPPTEPPIHSFIPAIHSNGVCVCVRLSFPHLPPNPHPIHKRQSTKTPLAATIDGIRMQSPVRGLTCEDIHVHHSPHVCGHGGWTQMPLSLPLIVDTKCTRSSSNRYHYRHTHTHTHPGRKCP